MGNKIYQIYYRDDQKSSLEPQTLHYKNNDKLFRCESGVIYDVWMRMQGQTYHELSEDNYMGFFSWKYNQKTGKLLKDIKYDKDFINLSPTHFNSQFIGDTMMFKSVWMQGEHWTPGILDYVVEMFKDLGIEQKYIYKDTAIKNLCFCNYFVAKESFWYDYMNRLFIPCYDWLYNKSFQVDNLLNHDNLKVPYSYFLFPYIMERLIITYLEIKDDESN